MDTTNLAIQDYYPPELSHCYGCGRLNKNGLQIKSKWLNRDKKVSIASFTPRPEHTAVPGFVYGGLLASLIDCHGTGTAAMAAYQVENRSWDSLPPNRFVTAVLNTTFLLPTPITLDLNEPAEIKILAEVTEVKKRNDRVYKVTVQVRLLSVIDDFQSVRVKGEVIAIQMPDTFSA